MDLEIFGTHKQVFYYHVEAKPKIRIQPLVLLPIKTLMLWNNQAHKM
jgi:hypothetical protein